MEKGIEKERNNRTESEEENRNWKLPNKNEVKLQ